jgi:hypothetical protein
MNPASGKTLNWILKGDICNWSCQQEKMKLDPVKRKLGTRSCQREILELDHANR